MEKKQSTTTNDPLDQVILVDPNDQEIGTMDKMQAHREGGVRHRAISVFLFSTEGKLLIQQRSPLKIVGGLQWANTCCGNVRPNETRMECALRRLREELGILNVTIHEVGIFEYHVKCNEEFSEWEIDQVFVGHYDGDVTPNPKEVESYQYVEPEVFQDHVMHDIEYKYAPWVKEIYLHISDIGFDRA